MVSPNSIGFALGSGSVIVNFALVSDCFVTVNFAVSMIASGSDFMVLVKARSSASTFAPVESKKLWPSKELIFCWSTNSLSAMVLSSLTVGSQLAFTWSSFGSGPDFHSGLARMNSFFVSSRVTSFFTFTAV